MVPRILKEDTKEFNELFGERIAIQEDTNLATDEEANERILIVEYKPDSAKCARIFDIGNGEWNFYDLIDRRNLIVFQEKVAERAKAQKEWYEKSMENVIEYPNKLNLNLYGNNWVIVNTWKDEQGAIHNVVVSGVYTSRENCQKECDRRNSLSLPSGKFSIRLITCEVKKVCQE